MREEKIRQEQKKSHRLSVGLYAAALLLTFWSDSLEEWFPVVLILGGIILLATWSDDKRTMKNNTGFENSPKSKWAALAICVFFGFIGVHYFYVGRVKMGLLYIITFGFFGIGWLIDIVRIICGVFTDKNGLFLKV